MRSIWATLFIRLWTRMTIEDRFYPDSQVCVKSNQTLTKRVIQLVRWLRPLGSLCIFRSNSGYNQVVWEGLQHAKTSCELVSTAFVLITGPLGSSWIWRLHCFLTEWLWRIREAELRVLSVYRAWLTMSLADSWRDLVYSPPRFSYTEEKLVINATYVGKPKFKKSNKVTIFIAAFLLSYSKINYN